jgi:hypothetical protein
VSCTPSLVERTTMHQMSGCVAVVTFALDLAPVAAQSMWAAGEIPHKHQQMTLFSFQFPVATIAMHV